MNICLNRFPALLASLTMALLIPLASTAHGAISNAAINDSSSPDDDWVTSSYASGRQHTATIGTDDGSTLETRYAFSVGAWNDSTGTMETDFIASYTIKFQVTAPGDYELQVDQVFEAAAQTIGFSTWGTATLDLGDFSGSSDTGSLDSGSLDIGYSPISVTTGYDESSPIHTTISETASAVISGTSNGSPVTHRITFEFSASCDSTAWGIFYPDGDHCGVRGGISTAYGNTATDYSTDSGTAAADGHVVTITLTEIGGGAICGNDTVEGDEECDGGPCCESNCTYSGSGAACGDAGDECTVADTCDGAGSCTDNGFAAAGAACGDAGNECTVADTCDGAGACTDNGFEAAGTACGSAGDQCTDADTCDGSGSCDSGGSVAAGTTCDDSNPLTAGESCLEGVCACGDGGDSPACTVNCGDDVVDSGEECDDGNNTDADGCSAACETEPEICGNDTVGEGEECDDGNTDDRDGCSSRCQDEVSQSKDQQKCLRSQLGYIAKAAKTQGKENSLCVRDAGKGKLDGSAEDCLTADRKGKVAKLTAKMAEKQTDADKGKCLSEPDFGYLAAAEFVPAVTAEDVEFFHNSFAAADDLGDTIVDATDKANKADAGCQAMLLKVSHKIVDARLKTFAKCVEKGLKARDENDRIISAVTMESCWGADADKVAKAVAKHAHLNAKKCAEKGADWSTVVAGDCAAATDADEFAACVDDLAACSACNMLNATLGLELDCDDLDDGELNDSCGEEEGIPPASPVGSFVDGPILF